MRGGMGAAHDAPEGEGAARQVMGPEMGGGVGGRGDLPRAEGVEMPLRRRRSRRWRGGDRWTVRLASCRVRSVGDCRGRWPLGSWLRSRRTKILRKPTAQRSRGGSGTGRRQALKRGGQRLLRYLLVIRYK